MDTPETHSKTHAISSTETNPAPTAAPAEVDADSQPFVGRWNRLVSTTNWEKGRIIHQWREALVEANAPATDFSDEAWARLVGGVTGQHVGRLRRVYVRFADSFTSFDSLYWSHFQAALDWEDAEMWLEGGVQNGWSVSQMRRQRWETIGGDEPQDEEIVVSELDEDFEPALNQEPQDSRELNDIATGPSFEGPDFGDEQGFDADRNPAAESESETAVAAVDLVRPFADMPELPDDLAEAFDSFKLAMLRHKAERWVAISQADVIAALESLKLLAQAPSSEEAPF